MIYSYIREMDAHLKAITLGDCMRHGSDSHFSRAIFFGHHAHSVSCLIFCTLSDVHERQIYHFAESFVPEGACWVITSCLNLLSRKVAN